MKNFFLNNISIFIPVFVLVLGGIGWLIKYIITKSQTKAIRESEERLSLRLNDLKNTQAISKETYEQIFKDRIYTYISIYKYINTYNEKMLKPTKGQTVAKLNNVDYDYDTDKAISEMASLVDEKVRLVEDIGKIISENQLFVSQSLWDSFIILKDNLQPYLYERKIIFDASEFSNERDDITYQKVEKLTEECSDLLHESIDNFIQAFEKDMKKIRSSIKFY